MPKIRTSGEGVFDYSIPPELLPQIKIGLLITIPFRGRKIEGVIIDIKRTSNFAKLKPIISIIDPVPVIDKNHIELAHWISKYYLCPFSKAIFENIAPPAKRAIKNQTEIIQTQKTRTKKFSKQYLLVANFQTRLPFYLKAINKTLANNSNVIILLPDLSLAKYFTNFLPKYTLYHANLKYTERWTEWNKIRQGQAKVVIGSISALFAPMANLGLVIIDQEENETYKSGQSPRFHAVKTARALAKITGANLILGSTAPRVETFYTALKQNTLLYKSKNTTTVTTVDMNFEKSILSLPLTDAVERNLGLKNKIILVLNRQGEGKYFTCSQCQWKQACPQCNLPLKPKKQIGQCSNCEKIFDLVTQCPVCKSNDLIPGGLSISKLAKLVQDKWPKSKIAVVEKDGLEIKINWDIAIVTNFALKLTFPQIALTGIIDADQDFNFPDFTVSERAFQKAFRFLKIAKVGIIQTRNPENETIKALAKMDYRFFFNQEIENRMQAKFPPFSNLIKLVYKDKDQEKAKAEAEKIANTLKELSKGQNISVLGPSTPYFSKRRDFYHQQIILKFTDLPSMVEDFLKALPPSWLIDVDPFDLL